LLTRVTPEWAAQLERALHVSDFTLARHLVERAQAHAVDHPSKAMAAYLAARCEFVCGAPEDGLHHALNAAALFESLGDAAGQAKARAVVARCFVKSGDAGSALDHALAAFQLAQEARPDEPSSARQGALLTLSIVYRRLRELDMARDFCQHALDCAIALSDRVAQGVTMDTLACVYSPVAAVAREAGRAQEAERHEREAMRCSTQAMHVARENGHLRYEATAVNNLAESMSHVGESLEALQLLDDWARDNPLRSAARAGEPARDPGPAVPGAGPGAACARTVRAGSGRGA
jgi:tetratricopeptide (TPR) repeat protein